MCRSQEINKFLERENDILHDEKVLELDLLGAVLPERKISCR